MHLCIVSCLLASESMLPLSSKSSADAPNVTSRRSTRCRTTRPGSMDVDVDEGEGRPLTPCPGETTSMMERHALPDGLDWCVT